MEGRKSKWRQIKGVGRGNKESTVMKKKDATPERKKTEFCHQKKQKQTTTKESKRETESGGAAATRPMKDSINKIDWFFFHSNDGGTGFRLAFFFGFFN